MAMENLRGASLTIEEVNGISFAIDVAAKNINSSLNEVDKIMTILTGQCEGGLIEKTTTAVQDLTTLCMTLLECVGKLISSILTYVQNMVSSDDMAKETLLTSTQYRVNEG